MQATATTAPGSVITPEARSGAKVLIVDDDERNAFAAIQALEELGHELIVARSGEEALRLLLQHDFAVILLDLHMPGMDGYETAGFIRAHSRTRNIPIVFVTAVFRDEVHVFQAYSVGAMDVVFKPVDPFILRSKVSILVDLHLKTREVTEQAERLKALLAENTRVQAEKAVAERSLRKTRERQQVILQSLPVVFHSRSADPPFAPTFVSPTVKAVTGFTPEEFIADPEFGLSRVHPDDRERVAARLASVREEGAYSCEFRWLCADGEYRTLFDQGILAPSQDTDQTEIFGVLLDATEQRALEEQLAQARKMEAVGQLTGGVAHDFNNLLTVVLGNAEMLSRRAGEDQTMLRKLEAIMHAAQGGRTLTRQLLAFSRRQQLSPVHLDLNALIEEFSPLLQQAVGEAVSIRVAPAGGPVHLFADPTHLETVLLNLAVNARDAMPGGGELSISVRLVDSSDVPMEATGSPVWAHVTVRDTGVGMPDEVAARAFEPFFTTKEVGKGSGLGLSQVYGFVRQSGGHIQVSSTVGEGTLFDLYLPTSSEAPAARPVAAPAEVFGGAEKLLVVEDDAKVLAFTTDMLRELGYGVVAARDAEQALKVLRSRRKIDGLFSDVVMPGGTSGVQLARMAREVRPGLPILLTSGYMGETPMPSNEFPLIDKPYERLQLAGRLREVLNGTSDRTATPTRRSKARARNDDQREAMSG